MQSLRIIIDILSKERKFDIIELCVKKQDEAAIRLYKNAGFAETGYIDPDAPDSAVLRYTFG